MDSLTSIPQPLALAGAVLVAGFLLTRLIFRERPIGQFCCKLVSLAAFTIMLAVSGVLPFKPTPAMDFTLTYLTISVFKIVWWLAAAWLVAGLVRALLVFKRQPVETRFLQDLCAGFVYVSAVLGIIAYVFDMPVSGLLAASGIVAIVLGLALQSTLGDVFSGVVLNLAKPYHPGDWIILDNGLEGRVVETDWRATHILTQSNDLAIVPNNVIAKARLVNASAPSAAHGVIVSFRLDPAAAPSAGIPVLETALLSCTQILRVPAATVTVQSMDAMALQYEIEFFVPSIEQAPLAQNEVFDRVYRHCASAGIRMAPPAGSSFVLPPREAPQDPTETPRRMLARLPIFASLSDDKRAALAPKMKRRLFRSGDVILKQGAISPALFILTSGVLAALQTHEGRDAEVLRLAPGECFGQASVMTGAAAMFKVTAVTRSIVYEIAKDDIAPILQSRPAIAAELGRVVAQREADGKMRLHELDDAQTNRAHLAGTFSDRVKLLFGLTR